MKDIRKIGLLTLMVTLFSGCYNTSLGPSILEDTPAVDSTLSTAEFDQYLYDNFLLPYNVNFIYRMSDAGSNQSYNVVPVTLENAEKVAHLVRYLWFDVYSTVAGPEFLMYNGPRVLHVIGSALINASQHTEILGFAEGGIKITIDKMNELDVTSLAMMNKYIFHVMHHEYSHILHQKKTYPIEYKQISVGMYDPDGWQNTGSDQGFNGWQREDLRMSQSDSVANSMGFITAYSRASADEDFVEIISSYITDTDEMWEIKMQNAKQGQIDKNTTGYDIIQRKLTIARDWLRDKWGLDLDALRALVQERQMNIDMEKIMHDDY